MARAGVHETVLADIAATIGESLAGDWFEEWIGSVGMALAAGVVIAQDKAAPDSAGRSAKERLKVLQEVCILLLWCAGFALRSPVCSEMWMPVL